MRPRSRRQIRSARLSLTSQPAGRLPQGADLLNSQCRVVVCVPEHLTLCRGDVLDTHSGARVGSEIFPICLLQDQLVQRQLGSLLAQPLVLHVEVFQPFSFPVRSTPPPVAATPPHTPACAASFPSVRARSDLQAIPQGEPIRSWGIRFAGAFPLLHSTSIQIKAPDVVLWMTPGSVKRTRCKAFKTGPRL